MNSGTSLYETGAAREFERSTEAHNSVAVDGESSSEVWASFRVARRAHPFGIEIEEKREVIVVRAAHDGYRRLPGDVTHWREWRFRPGGLVVSDRLDGTFERATSYFHLHPRFRLLSGPWRHRLFRRADARLCGTKRPARGRSLRLPSRVRSLRKLHHAWRSTFAGPDFRARISHRIAAGDAHPVSHRQFPA